jgi:hypothetical protein
METALSARDAVNPINRESVRIQHSPLTNLERGTAGPPGNGTRLVIRCGCSRTCEWVCATDDLKV